MDMLRAVCAIPNGARIGAHAWHAESPRSVGRQGACAGRGCAGGRVGWGGLLRGAQARTVAQGAICFARGD